MSATAPELPQEGSPDTNEPPKHTAAARKHTAKKPAKGNHHRRKGELAGAEAEQLADVMTPKAEAAKAEAEHEPESEPEAEKLPTDYEPDGDKPISHAVLDAMRMDRDGDGIADGAQHKIPTTSPEAEKSEDEPAETPAKVVNVDADDPATDRAVDDIVAKEADTVLAAEDQKLGSDVAAPKSLKDDTSSASATEAAAKPLPPAAKKREHHGLIGLFAAWWHHKKLRWATIIVFLAIVLAGSLLPTSRYLALNSVGVRTAMNVIVIDQSTQQPLKNAQVSISGVSGLTDSKGKASLTGIKLGPGTLNIQKRAFAGIEQKVVLGWGSNPLGQKEVKAVGAQYSFLVTDFLSSKPLEGAEAVSGEGNAIADKSGKLVLTLDTAERPDSDQISVKLQASGYREETVTLTVNNKETQAVKMVPSRKHAFVSKRSGKYDVYTIDLDGKNEKKVVAGTGLERDDITLVTYQGGNMAALVASRENVRNAEGYLLDTLYTIDLSDGSLLKVDQSEQLQLSGWTGAQRLVYVKIASGASAANPKRHRLMSFNAKNVADVKELASANYFNDVLLVGDKVYFAPSNAFQDDPHPGFFVINTDGSTQQTLLDKEVTNIFRTDFDTLDLDAPGSWYAYKLGAASATALGSTPSVSRSRLYINNTNSSAAVWVDNRDGKGVLLRYDLKNRQEKTIVTMNGLKTPATWITDSTVVFRITDGSQTADYAVSMDGGEPRKIADVTDTAGIDRWYYY